MNNNESLLGCSSRRTDTRTEMKMELKPTGWADTMENIPPGHFMWQGENGDWHLGHKSIYMTHLESGKAYPEAYNSAGEYFCAELHTKLWPCELVMVEEN